MKKRAGKNQTVTLDSGELEAYGARLLYIDSTVRTHELLDQTICGNMERICPMLPKQFVDLLFMDPPYNLTKNFNGQNFMQRAHHEYAEQLNRWISVLLHTLKPDASVYVCSDWRACGPVQEVLEQHFTIRNRITWEREKGRGAKRNWKNCSEDIWFCTVSNNYVFNVEDVKLKRRVIAPYTHSNGEPKDWQRSEEGGFRLTHPSNLWTDLTVPFWSMPENTDHPTQKPEKLLAKVILASSNSENIVFDPFVGSGTTSVVARKLGRHYVGIERDHFFCCLAEKRLDMALHNASIQGYADGVFWERNSLQARNGNHRNTPGRRHRKAEATCSLFAQSEPV